MTDVLNLLTAGLSHAEVVAELPDLELEDVKACLEYTAAKIDHPVLTA